jgi:arylsulfatase A-like enzyme
LEWLALRPEPGRPFFAFLNYYDAHEPYKLPDGATPRIARTPLTEDELRIIYVYWGDLDKMRLAPYYVSMARDAYDNCIAYVDEQLGAVLDELERRELLDRTLVIILSDHGEGLGEHGLFDHGQSLYSTEVRVPLLILPPGNTPSPRQVRDTVSLRDVPATVVDLVGLNTGAPFPGRSLARLWRDSTRTALPAGGDGALSELLSPSPKDPNWGRSPARRGPMISLAEGDLVYIRNEGDGTEELFNQRDDPRELTNRAGVDAFKPVLERFRKQVALFNPNLGRGDRGDGGRAP